MNRYYLLSLLSIIGLNAINEKPIVVVIPSYNNQQWYERNLNSVCYQNYTNYRIVYIDDCSPDGTGNLVQSYIDKHNMHDKVTLVRNEVNRGALYNLYTTIHQCADDEIIVTVDGDDWLKHKNVLKRVNQEYQKQNVWMTYGQFESYPKGTRGFCRNLQQFVIQKNAYREIEWYTSHLRTFYAGLFKQVKLKDLVHEGELFRVTWDMAFLFPMFEMADGKFSFIPDILYIYNEATPLSDNKLRVLQQLRCNKIIRGKDKYTPINSYTRCHNKDDIDLVIFSQDVQKSCNLLKQVEAEQWPISNIIMYVEQQRVDDYDEIKKAFDYVNVICFGETKSLSEHLHKMCQTDGYVLWTTDGVQIDEGLPLQEALQILHQTKALSCNFALHPQKKHPQCLKRAFNKPTLTHLSPDFVAWQFAEGEFDWREPFACTMTLFNKSDLYKVIKDVAFNSCAELQSMLHRSSIDLHEMGICLQKEAVRANDDNVYMPTYLAPLLKAGYKQSEQGLVKN